MAESDQCCEYRELRLVSVRTALENAANPQSDDGREYDRESVEDEIQSEVDIDTSPGSPRGGTGGAPSQGRHDFSVWCVDNAHLYVK